ncbi:glucokinase [Hyphococcus luteus]|uniref:Glucokinase n=1 Tax=Hyphococcus luteus TaxID=2058213 RepID=A0A2S7K3H8_9PROT|nr:glucokinase [Marinicaulis flavus]PQA86998.1 glucokinase [Marinicaulis flavus]
MTEPFLVADIGGTNARFALAHMKNGGIAVEELRSFRAEEFDSIRAAAHAYLEAVSVKPKTACFAVAGPVTDEQVEFTNSPWVLNIEGFKKALCLTRLRVVNDFEALASGVGSLRDKDFLEIKAGAGDPHAPTLVMGPGTGLGQALIVPFGNRERVVSTEGGHVSFAPRTDEEIALMQFIRREHARVSVERVVSGIGLVNIYRALCEIEDVDCDPMRADEITAAAIKGTHPIAVKTANMFCALLGRVAGDAVLGAGARGGVVLGGGILPKIRELFLKSAFVERFLDKGRMQYYLEDVPVRLIISDGTALLGAAAMAKGAEMAKGADKGAGNAD